MRKKGSRQRKRSVSGAFRRSGDGDFYAAVADVLCDKYKVIIYDQCANAPQNFEISQQSRDVLAVLHATGETSAFIFGNSSGAVIALDIYGQDPATGGAGSRGTRRRITE